MQGELIIINKQFFQKFVDFLKHPITTLVLGIVISYIFYVLSEKNKIPSYYLSQPVMVANKNDANLKIIYKGIEYKSIYYRKLIIWNEGSEYIDSNDFINTKPMKLLGSNDSKILSVSTISTSRNDLEFESNIINNNLVTFRILNDEAMEENDGTCFHILYSDNKNGYSNFKFLSRIKGTTNGFIFKDLKKLKTNSNKKSIYILWSILILILSMRVLTLVVFKKNVVFRKWEIVFLIVFSAITIYETVDYIFYSTNLNWLN